MKRTITITDEDGEFSITTIPEIMMTSDGLGLIELAKHQILNDHKSAQDKTRNDQKSKIKEENDQKNKKENKKENL